MQLPRGQDAMIWYCGVLSRGICATMYIAGCSHMSLVMDG